MNLKTISQTVHKFKPEMLDLNTVFNQSLLFAFLEKEKEIKKIKPNISQNVKIIPNLDPINLKTIHFLSENNTHFEIISFQINSCETTSIFIPKIQDLINIFTYNNFLFLITNETILFYENNQSICTKRLLFNTNILLDYRVFQNSNSVEFLIQGDNNAIQKIIIDLHNKNITIGCTSTQLIIRKAIFVEEKILILTYFNQIVELLLISESTNDFTLKNIKTTINCINDIKFDINNKMLIFLINHQTLCCSKLDGNVLFEVKIEGIYTKLIISNGLLIAIQEGFQSLHLFLEITNKNTYNLNQMFIILDDFIGFLENNEILTKKKHSNEFDCIKRKNKVKAVHHKIIRFLDKNIENLKLNSNLEKTHIWKTNPDDLVFNIFAVLENKTSLLFKSDSNGLSKLIHHFTKETFPDISFLVEILGNCFINGTDYLLICVNLEGTYFIMTIDIISFNTSILCEIKNPFTHFCFINKHQLLLFSESSNLHVYIFKNNGLEFLQKIEFQDNLVSIAVKNDIFIACGELSSVHFYRFHYKLEKFSFSYLAGDFKSRKLEFGAFIDDNNVHYVLESGKNMFISLNHEKCFSRTSNGFFVDKQSPSAISDDILLPHAKYTSNGIGLLFKKLNFEQIEYLKNKRKYFDLIDSKFCGLVFDSIGNIDLVCKTGEQIAGLVSEGDEEFTQKQILEALLKVHDQTSDFIHEDIFDLKNLKLLKKMEANWELIIKGFLDDKPKEEKMVRRFLKLII